MDDVDWLARASRFDFGDPPPVGIPPSPTITIERRSRGWHVSEGHGVVKDGHDMWAVCHLGFVLNKELEWEDEPLPSSRTEEFIQRTRWGSYEEAWAAAEKAEL